MTNYIDELLNPASAFPQEPVQIQALPSQDPQRQKEQAWQDRDEQVALARQWNAAYEARDGALSKLLADSTEQAAAYRSALKQAEAIGVSPDKALEDPRVALRLQREVEFRRMKWQADHPYLAQMLEDPRFARAAADDMESLLEDDGWWTRVGNAFTSAYTSFEAADIGRRRAMGSDTAYDIVRLNEIGREQARLGKTDGPSQWIATQLGRISYQLPSGLAAAAAGAKLGPWGALGGFMLNTFAWTGYEEFGGKYNELKSLDATDEEALYGAMVSGLLAGSLEAGLETVTFRLAKPLFNDLVLKGVKGALADKTSQSALAAFGKGLAKEVASEQATELGQLLASELGTYVAEQVGDPKDLGSFTDMADKITRTIYQTAVVATTFGLVPAGIQAASVKAKVVKAEESKAFMDQMAETDGKSKIVKEAPTIAEEHLRRQAERTGVKTLYVSREEMRLALEEQAKIEGETVTPQQREEIIAQVLTKLDEKVPGIKEQYESAPSGQTDIEIDIAKYRASGLSTTEIHKSLTKYGRFDSSMPSLAKAKEMQPLIDNFSEVMRLSREQLDENGMPNADASVTEIRETFLEALRKVPDANLPVQAGATPDAQRQFLATQAANVFKMMAVRNLDAMPPKEISDEDTWILFNC